MTIRTQVTSRSYVSQTVSVRLSLLAIGLAAAAWTVPVAAVEISEWEQFTTAQFILDSSDSTPSPHRPTYRIAPHDKTSESRTTLAWSDRDSTSSLSLRVPGTAISGNSDPVAGASVHDTARTIGVGGVTRDHAEATGMSGGLEHVNTVIQLDHFTLQSAAILIQGDLRPTAPIVGDDGTQFVADPFEFMTNIHFIETRNGDPCPIDDGSRCADLLVSSDSELLGTRELIYDGVRYLHSAVLVSHEQDAMTLGNEQCSKVPSWSGTGGCLGFVTAETGGNFLEIGFQVARVPEPLMPALLGSGLLALGVSRRLMAA